MSEQATRPRFARPYTRTASRDGLHAFVTDHWYGEAASETHRDGPFRVACQREFLLCRDPRDPGSTEVWAHYSHDWLGGMHATAAESEATAKARALVDNGADIRCDERFGFENPLHLLRPLEAELVEDDSFDLMPPAHERDTGTQRGL